MIQDEHRRGHHGAGRDRGEVVRMAPYDPAYIGRCRECGAIRAGIYDNPDNPSWTAKFVAQMIESGLMVEYGKIGQIQIQEHRPDCSRK